MGFISIIFSRESGTEELPKARFSAIASSAWLDGFCYHSDVTPWAPPHRFPEGNALCIAVENKDVGLLNSSREESASGLGNKRTSQAVSTTRRMDSQMVDVPASAVVTGKN
jgi:hypothetical protein